MRLFAAALIALAVSAPAFADDYTCWFSEDGNLHEAVPGVNPSVTGVGPGQAAQVAPSGDYAWAYLSLDWVESDEAPFPCLIMLMDVVNAYNPGNG